MENKQNDNNVEIYSKKKYSKQINSTLKTLRYYHKYCIFVPSLR